MITKIKKNGKKLQLICQERYVRWTAAGLIALYVVFVISPLILLVLFRLKTERSFLYELGRTFALIGFPILAMQLIISARFKFMVRPFGLDIVLVFHKYMGIFAALLFLLHPVLLTIGSGNYDLLTSVDQPWYVWMGKICLTVLIAQSVLSIYIKELRLKYEGWRFVHNTLALAVLGFGFLHSFFNGLDLAILASMRILWFVLAGLAILSYLYHRLVHPIWLRHHYYRVTEVIKEAHNVWTIKFASQKGRKRIDYLPGQFQFITLYREKGLPVEEHPFTISSSPTDEVFFSSTIKNLGDFTSTIGKTKPGDKAVIRAPYGRFSYLLYPEESDLVFIAGGIGITPLMSMLRYMKDTKSERNVLLLYGNRTEQDIVFRNELSEIEAGRKPDLKLVHVLSNAGNRWKGETGYIDREKIERFCGDMKEKSFYICGPPVMFDKILKILKELGVESDHIHTERFAF